MLPIRFYSLAQIRQTTYKYIVVMTKKGSTKIANFMTPGASCAGAWPYRSYSENALII